MSTNRIRNVAIVGATGRIGKHFAEALLATGQHTVTALVRPDTKTSELPAGIKTAAVDYSNPTSITSALSGQDFLAITLGVRAPPDLHSVIVKAAGEAKIPWIMPNVYGSDITNTSLAKDETFLKLSIEKCEEVKATGTASYIAMACGFWYEWSLALGEQWFGFDIKARKVTFYDDGKTKISISTWPQCGRALAALLSLPVEKEGEGPALVEWRDRPVFLSSFYASQRDMLDSLHRVLGTKDEDWEIRFEDSTQRVEDGKAELARGDFKGFAKQMYARAMKPDGSSDFEDKLDNEKLGLKKEDIDQSTRNAVEMVNSGWNPLGL